VSCELKLVEVESVEVGSLKEGYDILVLMCPLAFHLCVRGLPVLVLWMCWAESWSSIVRPRVALSCGSTIPLQ
jgi:hypothetical protein